MLQQFSFLVSYCRGVENAVADFFSRNPDSQFHEQKDEMLVISSLHQYFSPVDHKGDTSLITLAMLEYDRDLARNLKNLTKLQFEDEVIKKIIIQCREKEDFPHFTIYNNILFHQEEKDTPWRIVVPEKLQYSLMVEIHKKLGHPGVFKTLSYLRKFYYWKRMHTKVKKYILGCDLCQRVKYLTLSMEGEHNHVVSDGVNDLITVDFYGPLPMARGGVQYIFVMLDVFSKYVNLYPMKKATVRMCIKKIFNHFIPKFGKPKRILSDHGTQFTSIMWRKELETAGIKILFSSIRHPQSNPTERVMRELGRLFRVLCSDKHTKWAEFVPQIEETLNVTVHQSTGFAPLELHFGQSVQDKIHKFVKFPEAQVPSHQYIITLARENLMKNFKKRKKQQRSVSKVKLELKDLVLLRVRHLSNALDKVIQKFFHLFEGPYRIIQKIGENAFVLADPEDESKKIGTYNRLNLRKYYINSPN